ncbi:conserved hypothetical protein [Crenothrix polyspora]|uniref:Cytochrome c domain-containing protein n=1 Tax=Crenothrix polyspora TaxID=360316 RepID=A0A1R4HI29_9GAMM|nr:ABC transporter substrate-binding protein [Crenothrix polyspora]SJM95908.1 conserved hypothetical protein [Crenothrix polyspora]
MKQKAKVTGIIYSGLGLAKWFIVCGLGVLAAPLDSFSDEVAPHGLTEQALRGKKIYVDGTSVRGNTITAVVGQSSTGVPATLLPCANCHGQDGQGKQEGGVQAVPIAWEVLKQSVGQEGGLRKRKAYTASLFGRAVAQGIDPSDNLLSEAMPRYQFSQDDLDDLVAYLAQMDKKLNEGVSDSDIRIGLLLPPHDSALAELGDVVKRVMEAYLSEINQKNGIYRRTLSLQIVETGDSVIATSHRLQSIFDGWPVLAMANAFIGGAEAEITALMAKAKVPLIAPLTAFVQTKPPMNPYVFYLFPRLHEQAEALVKFAQHRFAQGKPHINLLLPKDDDSSIGITTTLKALCKQLAWGEVGITTYVRSHLSATQLVTALNTEQSLVFFLGPAEDIPDLVKALQQQLPTGLFFLEPSVNQNIFTLPSALRGRVYAAFPRPINSSSDGFRDFQLFASRNHLPEQYLSTQLAAYSAMKILVEGIKRAGRDVGHEQLLQALEGFSNFDTGLPQPVSYSKNSHIGNEPGIVAVDLEHQRLLPVSE